MPVPAARRASDSGFPVRSEKKYRVPALFTGLERDAGGPYPPPGPEAGPSGWSGPSATGTCPVTVTGHGGHRDRRSDRPRQPPLRRQAACRPVQGLGFWLEIRFR